MRRIALLNFGFLLAEIHGREKNSAFTRRGYLLNSPANLHVDVVRKFEMGILIAYNRMCHEF